MSAESTVEEAHQVLDMAERLVAAIGAVTKGQRVTTSLHALMVATARIGVANVEKGREGAFLVCVSDYMLEMAENYPVQRDPPELVR